MQLVMFRAEAEEELGLIMICVSSADARKAKKESFSFKECGRAMSSLIYLPSLFLFLTTMLQGKVKRAKRMDSVKHVNAF